MLRPVESEPRDALGRRSLAGLVGQRVVDLLGPEPDPDLIEAIVEAVDEVYQAGFRAGRKERGR